MARCRLLVLKTSDLLSYHLYYFTIPPSEAQFSTKDNDVTVNSCAQRCLVVRLYTDCRRSNLNGLYLGGPHSSDADGVNWVEFFRRWQYSLKRTEMKVK